MIRRIVDDYESTEWMSVTVRHPERRIYRVPRRGPLVRQGEAEPTSICRMQPSREARSSSTSGWKPSKKSPRDIA